MFQRRIGPDPHANGDTTPNSTGCPDIWELEGGDFMFIGKDVTSDLRDRLPATVSCGPDERIIKVPRRSILVNAKHDIPES